MRWGLLLVSALALSGCDKLTVTYGDLDQDELRAFFEKHKVGKSVSYAVYKNSLGLESYLLTIHGYVDNRTVCESFIEPLNSGEEASVFYGQYRCVELKL